MPNTCAYTVDTSGLSAAAILECWRWLLPEKVTILIISALGDLFLEDEQGNIQWVDVGAGTISTVAASRDQFAEMLESGDYIEQWFNPQLVNMLVSSGKRLERNECFSFVLPPTLSGSYDDPANYEPCDLMVHFGVIGQIQEQVRDLPEGTLIKEFVTVNMPKKR